MSMYSLAQYHYELPVELIAQVPAPRRDEARLMVVNRRTGLICHTRVWELEHHLRPDDLLVVNDTRVVPARLVGRKETGGKVEVLILHPALEAGPYHCLIKASKPPKPGMTLIFADGVRAKVCERTSNGQSRLEFVGDLPLLQILDRIGCVPLPPYIRRNHTAAGVDDCRCYQAIYARRPGAIAAPTAGLHFSEALLAKLQKRGIQLVSLTLHVGFGTFQPVRETDIRKHRLEKEYFEIPPQTALAINEAKDEGRRLVAVGTTTVRALEFAWRQGRVQAEAGWCDLFIYPGYRFRVIDALFTNFHLPGSSLLMLVSAWAGCGLTQKAYAEAVRRRYRFYSYGDAMFVE